MLCWTVFFFRFLFFSFLLLLFFLPFFFLLPSVPVCGYRPEMLLKAKEANKQAEKVERLGGVVIDEAGSAVRTEATALQACEVSIRSVTLIFLLLVPFQIDDIYKYMAS